MLESFNELRNDLAHNLESKKLNKRIQKFIKSTGKTVPVDESESHVGEALGFSIRYLLGYLAAMEYMIKTGEMPPDLTDDVL